jgi:ABC-type nitrate/sulfonate/bicarbonate transport system substrate-binding protein
MKWNFAGTMSPYFAAQENGIFKNSKLNIELTEGGPGRPSSIQQVLLKQASFGITGAHELAVARSQDQPVVSLAVIFKSSPVCLLTIDERLINPVDLVGKTVEITTGDNAEFEYLSMLKKTGVNPDLVHVISWKYTYHGLLAGTSDAIVAYENDQPITLQSEFLSKGKNTHLMCPRNFGVTPYADVLFTTDDMIKSYPELVGKTVESFLSSWEWANTHIDETVSLFLKSPQMAGKGLEPEIQIAVLRKSLDFVKGSSQNITNGEYITDIGIQERERWQETLDLLKMYGNIEKLPEPESLFNNRWARQHEMAHKQNGM